MKVLVLTEWYLPGWRAGGALRSMATMVEACSDRFEFWVIARDRDLGDTEPYPGLLAGQWISTATARVLYVAKLRIRILLQSIRTIHPDVVYLNSFFSPWTILFLLLKRLGFVGSARTIIAPRGEFSPGALQIKALKKSAYRKVFRALGLGARCEWHGSTQEERDDVLNGMASHRERAAMAKRVWIASDRPILPERPSQAVRAKSPGFAKLIFVSRISPMKNLDWALDLLQDLSGDIEFEIYGPESEPEYSSRCRAIADKLPRNIRVAWKGPLNYEKVNQAFASAHYFLFPTKGENFGHVIFESLAAGTPVLLSDQTPWTGLPEAGAGWCTPLSNREGWAELVQQCVDMSREEYGRMSMNARNYIETWYGSKDFGGPLLNLLTGSNSQS